MEHLKLPSNLSSVDDAVDEVSAGCVMHRYKGYKRKRRWGHLRVEMKDKKSRCVIQLCKHDMMTSTPDTSKAKEPKIKYELEFTNDEFCGLEMGDHYDRYGMRRYLCIITKSKHLIIEDAVVTAAGINHNVLRDWYQLISKFMQYINRWRVVESNPKLASKICYLHISAANVSECHSLEDRTRENRNCLVLRFWRTLDINDVKEQSSFINEKTLTDISFNVVDNSGNLDIVNVTVEGTPPNLRQIIQQLKRSTGVTKKTTTVCPGFDDLNCYPNLVKIPNQGQGKSLRKILTKSLSGTKSSGQDVVDMHQAKKQNRNSHGNLYVKLEKEDEKLKPPPYYNVNAPPECIERNRDDPFTCNHHDDPSRSTKGAPCLHDSNTKIRVPPSLLDHSPTRGFDPELRAPVPSSLLPLNGWNAPGSPPQLPSPGLDDNDLKKAPGLQTQTSSDSAYNTGANMSTILTESDFTQGRYVNVQRGSSEPEFPLNGSLPRSSSALAGLVYQNLPEACAEQPPAIPIRDDQIPAQPYINITNRTTGLSSNVQAISQPPPRPPKKTLSEPLKLNEIDHQRAPSAPPVPQRQLTSEEELSQRSQAVDLVASSIQLGTLPPLVTEEEQRAYENSIAFEVTINEVLQGSHTGGRWLDLEHSVFITIALRLEKEGITVGDWKSLAEKLGLNVSHIQHLAALMRVHATLRPLEVLLLHWSRTQSPIPFTRANLVELLKGIGRDDLAHLIPQQNKP